MAMASKLKQVKLYTDGACLGNPGVGGWAALLIYQGQHKIFSGASADTTNNQMELQAVIEGLKRLREPVAVDIYTDSKYVKDGMESWLKKWQANHWKTASRKPVKNKQLWQDLLDVAERHELSWHWVKGHAGDPLNEEVDEAARLAAKQYKDAYLDGI